VPVPGMAEGSVIRTSGRSLFSYFIKPITD
jgi:hypothetical protein